MQKNYLEVTKPMIESVVPNKVHSSQNRQYQMNHISAIAA